MICIKKQIIIRGIKFVVGMKDGKFGIENQTSAVTKLKKCQPGIVDRQLGSDAGTKGTRALPPPQYLPDLLTLFQLG